MKIKILYLLLVLSLLTCKTTDVNLKMANEQFEQGNFKKSESIIQEILKNTTLNSEKSIELSYTLDLMHRIKIDFNKDEEKVKSELLKYYPVLTDSMVKSWENSGQLEYRIIDGEKRYFRNAVANFFRVNKEAKELKQSKIGKQKDAVETFKKRRIPELFAKGIAINKETFDNLDIKIDYTITVDANVVPENETIRCWMPYPRISNRLPKVEFLGTLPENPVIAPENQIQRTLYLEQKAIKDSSTVFKASFVIHTASQWFGIKAEDLKPYNKNSEIYKEFTLERPPQITFSDQITRLARQIVGNETNPYLQVKKLYYWMNDNIPWASALEYSIMPCIPEYVIKNKRGDCGMQSLLLISMARSLGIPAKWQSGWYLLPEEINLHDWVEIYYENIGWVPVDPSFKLIDNENINVKEFYLNGLDSYRLIVNDDFGRELFPKKKYPRSEPYDFQRGEIEWSGGNIYFDQWDYHMNVTYLTKAD